MELHGLPFDFAQGREPSNKSPRIETTVVSLQRRMRINIIKKQGRVLPAPPVKDG